MNVLSNRKSIALTILLIISIFFNIKLITDQSKQSKIKPIISIPANTIQLSDYSIEYNNHQCLFKFSSTIRNMDDYINNPYVYQDYGYTVSFIDGDRNYSNDTIYQFYLENHDYVLTIDESKIDNDFKEVLLALIDGKNMNIIPNISIVNIATKDNVQIFVGGSIAS